MKKIFLNLVILTIVVYSFAQVPEWQWAEQIQVDPIYNNTIASTIDGDGNCYIVGHFESTIMFGDIILTGYNDAFIAKIDALGNWQWAILIDGGNARGRSISTDLNDNIFIAGSFSFNVNLGPYYLESPESSNFFIAKLDSDGNWLWAEQATGEFECNGISYDLYGNAYITGKFGGTVQFGTYSITSVDGWDILVAKYSPDGNCLWIEQAGGIEDDKPEAICTDVNGNSYVTGSFSGTAMFGPHTLIPWGSDDIFVAKIETTGNWLWAERAGSPISSGGKGICISSNEYLYVTGDFWGTAAFGPISLTSNGACDIFLAKLDSEGNWLQAEKAGGDEQDTSNGISIDTDGSAFVTGLFRDVSTFGSFPLISNGDTDIFIAKLENEGTWMWALDVGGIGCDAGTGISTDIIGNNYIVGTFQYSVNFGNHNLASFGTEDFFVAKLSNPVSAGNDLSSNINCLKNYPNPFNPAVAGRSPTTTISFNLTAKDAKNAKLEIYNLKGQKVKQFLDIRNQTSVVWDGTDDNNKPVSSGIYFYKLQTESITETRKMILLK